jgi:hypothetical protein
MPRRQSGLSREHVTGTNLESVGKSQSADVGLLSLQRPLLIL